jgi:chemotaxis protein methyltransferase CheR
MPSFPKSSQSAPSEDLQTLAYRLAADHHGFNQLSILLSHLTGVRLENIEKNYSLMSNRICPILISHGLKSYEEYLTLIGQGPPEVVTEFISVMTTHTTQFFREIVQIEEFQKTIPKVAQEKKTTLNTELRLWCAAASTGQEPYSLALALLESFNFSKSWTIKFLATDIDLAALEKAAKGQYSRTEIATLPQNYRSTYTREVIGSNGELFQIDRKLQSMIQFAPLNLLERHYPFKKLFDFIFCRNVLYYFGQMDAEKIVQKMTDALAPGGHLIVGTNESSYIKVPNLERIGTAFYRKKS